MDLREVGYDGRDWINLAQDRDQRWAYVRATMNLRVPYMPNHFSGCKSSLSGKAPCKADLNNFKEKLFLVPGIDPGPLVERASALPTEAGNSTRHRLNFSLYITLSRVSDETPETQIECTQSHRDWCSMWVSGVSSAHASCVDIKRKVETLSGGVPGSSGRELRRFSWGEFRHDQFGGDSRGVRLDDSCGELWVGVTAIRDGITDNPVREGRGLL
ncbi:hypothetical protein ANN_29296 [Periplaneta americana]|uniref:Uncharacterized protein n=1 Tax=Periplaneta americana TaxID=6978 RepID=A0ABQ8SZM0_PERAM|nr:hypothetical protein ANN_29296 [Periplaneta americana]